MLADLILTISNQIAKFNAKFSGYTVYGRKVHSNLGVGSLTNWREKIQRLACESSLFAAESGTK